MNELCVVFEYPIQRQLPCDSAGQKCGPKNEEVHAFACLPLHSVIYLFEVSVTEKHFPGRIVSFWKSSYFGQV